LRRVERERFLVVLAEDLEQLGDGCASLDASMRHIGLSLERSEDVDEGAAGPPIKGVSRVGRAPRHFGTWGRLPRSAP